MKKLLPLGRKIRGMMDANLLLRMKKLLPLGILLIAPHVLFAATGWTDNFDKALAQAKTEKKLVLLDFTGSDWGCWCIKIDNEVFAKQDFKNFARNNLVPVALDFPHGRKLAKQTADQNAKLKEQFGVKTFPTLVLLDTEGRELHRWHGFHSTFFDDLKGKVSAAKAK